MKINVNQDNTLYYLYCTFVNTPLYLCMKPSLIITGSPDKRITDSLPKHLKKHERLPLQEVPESIYEKTSMGASSFSLFLHQNYLAFFSDIESVSKAADYLSHSDILSAEWMVSIKG